MSQERQPARSPTPASIPRPGPRPGPPRLPAVSPTSPDASDAARFGRVDDDGTVYVRTPDGERPVGSFPGACAEEALAYYARKFDEVLAQVEVFEQRLASPDIPIGEVESGLAGLRASATDLKAVGDLAELQARIDALGAVVVERRKQAEAERLATREQARVRRAGIVEEAERLAAATPEQTQWRADGQLMKDLFDAWRAEQKGGVRLDRRVEDELWKRFSHARTAFDRKRRQHFATLDEQHAEAKAAKLALVKEAEALQGSTDWGPTAAAYKRLMDRWRAAGRAARKDDDSLWERFRAAQDAFFTARHAVQADQEAQFVANLAVKERLLAEAETLVPITDLTRAKSRLRAIQERWEAAGKVPRADMERVERRLRDVEQAVRTAEEARWRGNNPEARARAQSAVGQLEATIAGLEADLRKATDQGRAGRVAQAEAALAARREWLEQARKALRDFGG